jgi:hypothetical protein
VVVVALAFASAVATAATAGTAGGGGGPQWIHGEMFPGIPDGITICGEFWPLGFEFRSCAAHHRQCLACCADSKIVCLVDVTRHTTALSRAANTPSLCSMLMLAYLHASSLCPCETLQAQPMVSRMAPCFSRAQTQVKSFPTSQVLRTYEPYLFICIQRRGINVAPCHDLSLLAFPVQMQRMLPTTATRAVRPAYHRCPPSTAPSCWHDRARTIAMLTLTLVFANTHTQRPQVWQCNAVPTPRRWRLSSQRRHGYFRRQASLSWTAQLHGRPKCVCPPNACVRGQTRQRARHGHGQVRQQ